ncbi:barstar family protein [Deefgea rivuli]|uniref:barstar family protein n=1 Tax=Deefgea rivuli TaxID=400948 RepID=UPI000489535D|nr:barstar family protein [Deefgea rivuli]
MPIKTQIQLRQIRTLHDIYQQLGEQIELPAEFGANLDALYDFLSTDLAGPIQIHWPDCQQSLAFLDKKDAEAIMNLFKDIADERDDFELIKH